MSGFACCVGLGDGSGPGDPVLVSLKATNADVVPFNALSARPLAEHAHSGLRMVILYAPLAKGLG